MPNDTSECILIVDDSSTNIMTVRGMLGDAYRLRFAQSGPEALALLAEGLRPDLILLDVMMPEMDGYAVCAALKADPEFGEVPVIFITARADPENETRALAAGGLDFIHKPLNTAVLRARVGVHLALRRQARALARQAEALGTANAELSQHRDHLEALVQARTRELAQARDAAESADRAKGAFLAVIGHELRTPMHQVMGSLHLLRRRTADPQLGGWIDRGEDAARRLLGLVDDLLQYTASEAQTIPIAAGDFALADLLAEAERRARPAAAAKGLELAVSVDPAVPAWLRGDRALLQRILGLLLDNAVKFSEHGRIVLSVAPHPGQDGPQGAAPDLRFEVSDQGIGITTDIQDRLFSLFEQGDGSLTRRYGGTGLGLALCKRLVALMAGEIGFTSIPGEGSRFRVDLRLPAAAAGGPGDTVEGADRQRVSETLAALTDLVRASDFDALVLWGNAEPLLAPVLGDRRDALEEALLSADFETAWRLLEGVTA